MKTFHLVLKSGMKYNPIKTEHESMMKRYGVPYKGNKTEADFKGVAI